MVLDLAPRRAQPRLAMSLEVEGMTQTNLTRPQGLNRLDPVLREAASELGVVEFRAETLPAEREHANRLAAERAARESTPNGVSTSKH